MVSGLEEVQNRELIMRGRGEPVCVVRPCCGVEGWSTRGLIGLSVCVCVCKPCLGQPVWDYLPRIQIDQ